MLLGAITLDLFAVLVGGGVALLPIYAREILHVGPVGLGVLRAAPAVGALGAAVILARRPLRRAAGPTLIAVVVLFGAANIVWGASKWLPLTLVALAVAGFVDMISVNIRSTTVALVTPNELRGRVGAVEMVFISRLERARRVRVGSGRGAGRNRGDGRRRRRRHDRDRARLDQGLPRAGADGEARGAASRACG